MPLSRHFYALDEVCAALAHATTRNDVRETLFWCLELLDSGCAAEAISTLFEAWLWQKGPMVLSWWTTAGPLLSGSEVSEEDILLCAYQLSTVSWERRDASLWTVLAATDLPPDRVTPRVPPTLFETLTLLEQFMMRSVHQGRGAGAWWAAEQLPWPRVKELLAPFLDRISNALDGIENYQDVLGYQSDAYDRVIKALTVLSACLSASQRNASLAPLPTEIPTPVQESLQRWRAAEGRVARRVYSIPTDCLYGQTVRGTLSWFKSTIVQLNDAEEYLQGCPFWDDRLNELVENQEEFYVRCFPDGHPDEWNAAEKAKSHGDGTLRPGEIVNMRRFTILHMGKWSRLAWDTAPKGLEDKKTPEEVFGGVSSVTEAMVRLEPLRRRRVLA